LNAGTYASIFGCLTQEKRFEVITNNLANINTSGFKKDRAAFRYFLVRSHDDLEYSAKVKAEATVTDFSQGQLVFTGNDIDVAIQGKGFFQVETPKGMRFTRQGSLSLNSERVLTTSQGYPVLGNGKPIVLPICSTTFIDESGTIFCDGNYVDKLDVVEFPDSSVIQKEGLSLFRTNQPVGPTPVPGEEYEINQGYLERSNVNVIEEMINMIECLRNYEAHQKTIQTFSETDHESVAEVGRLV
jgi:flagellar basal-body rod protein FlgF